jgi:hypothetical protein
MQDKTGPRGIKRISSALGEVVNPVYKKRGFAEAKLISDWEQIVGADIAAFALPVKLSGLRTDSDHTLVLKTSGGHALELQHLAPVILERIAAYMGYKAIQRIKIIHE